MKNIASFAVNCIFSILLVLGLVWCLITSFEISVIPFAIIFSSVIFTVVFALLSSLLKSKAKFWMSIAIIAIIYIFTLLFSLEAFLESLNYVINCILKFYSQYLPVAGSVQIVDFSYSDSTVFFTFLSVLICGVFSVSIIRFKHIFPVAILTVAILVPCFILVNTLPSLVPLLAVISSLFSLYVTAFILRHNYAQSGAVLITALAVIFISAVIICIFNPIEDYERFEWQDNLLEQAQKITGIVSNDESNTSISKRINKLGNSVTEKENLSEIGPLKKSGEKVMRIYTESGGKTYLKGLSYADYNNNSWSLPDKNQLKEYPENFNPFEKITIDETQHKELSVITEDAQGIIYTPYFSNSIPDDFSILGDICVQNDDKLLSYDIDYTPFSDEINYSENTDSSDYQKYVYDTYLQLPESTKAKMLEIAEKNGIEIPDSDFSTYTGINATLMLTRTVEQVREFVSHRGYYSLDTQKMPEGKDFAEWFLEEAESGYCVHYATSAAVMLRALGIPARYTTGYYVYADSNGWTTVTSDNAHAWVEYYDNSLGWKPLEATPSSFYPAEYNPQSAQTKPTQNSSSALSPTIQSTTQAVTSPTSSNGESDNKKITINKKAKFDAQTIIILSLVFVAVIICIIAVRRAVILYLRKKRFNSGSSKKRAVYIYRYIENLHKFMHSPVPDKISRLAEKARFSKHRLDESEIQILLEYEEKTKKELYKNSSFIKKIYLKIIAIV